MTDSTTSIDDLLVHAGWLHDLARCLVGEPGADDLVQEVWLRVADRPPARVRSPRGWLATVLRHVHARSAERRGAADAREREVARPELLPGADELAERAEAQRRLVEAVLDLDEPYRRTLLLRFFEGHSPTEIARDGGESASTIRTRLARGIAELRERLDEREGGRAQWMSGVALLARPPRRAAAATALLPTLVMWKTIPVLVAALAALSYLGWRQLGGPAEPRATPGPTPGSGIVAADGEPERADVASVVEDGARTPASAPEAHAEVEAPAPAPDPAPDAPAILGRVLDPSGEPVAGAIVYEGSLAQVSMALRFPDNPRRPQVGTDELGAFRLEVPPDAAPPVFVVSAHADGFAASEERLVELAPGGSRDGVELVLREGAWVEGQVFGIDHAPIAERLIQLSSPDLGEFRKVVSDADGRFREGPLNPGPWRAATYPSPEELEAAGKPSGNAAEIAYLAQAEFHLDDGDVFELEIGRPSADSPHVAGVLSHAGAPISAMLQWYPAHSSSDKQMCQADESGRFEIDLPAAGAWIVHANVLGADSRGQRQLVELAPGARHELNIDLVGGRAAGRVVDVHGVGIEGVQLELRTVADAPPQPEPTMGGMSIHSDADGAYAFELLPPGTYAVVAHGSRPGDTGTSFAGGVSEAFEVRGTDEQAVADLQLEAGAFLELSVTDDKGRPVGGGSVWFHDAEGRSLNPTTQTTTSSRGAASSPMLPLGDVWVTVTHREGATAPRRVDVGAEGSVELRLEPARWLELDSSVHDPAVDPLELRDACGLRFDALCDLRRLFEARPPRDEPVGPLLGPLPLGAWTIRTARGEVTLELTEESPTVVRVPLD